MEGPSGGQLGYEHFSKMLWQWTCQMSDALSERRDPRVAPCGCPGILGLFILPHRLSLFQKCSQTLVGVVGYHEFIEIDIFNETKRWLQVILQA